MAAQDVAYVELFVYDKQTATDYFVASLGFTPVAESANDKMDSVLLRQGTTQLIISTGPGTRTFLEAHGDGVADIAFTCDDVVASRDAAVAAGASATCSGPGGPVLSGFGDTCHTLLPVPANRDIRLPSGRSWVSIRPAPVQPVGRIQFLDHIAVCLESGTMADCADYYCRAFGLARYSSEYIEVGDQAMDSIVVRSLSGGITFTLLEPDSEKNPGQLDAFLDRNSGPGTQHLAFEVNDIIVAVHEARSRGVEFLSIPPGYYDVLSERLPQISADIASLRAAHVLADRDEWGYLLQLFTRSPYERNTLFYEFIQRRGARGFGGANIRSLYEAVERDRLSVF